MRVSTIYSAALRDNLQVTVLLYSLRYVKWWINKARVYVFRNNSEGAMSLSVHAPSSNKKLSHIAEGPRDALRQFNTISCCTAVRNITLEKACSKW